jgi:hypothetical protein
MRFLGLALLLLCSCGKRVEARPPQNVVEELNVEIERVQPLLVRCNGAPGKLPCEDMERASDTLGLIAYERLAFADLKADEFVLNSIAEDGKPFRSPAHRIAGIDSFSRDHVISLMQWSLASGNVEPLRRVIAYASRNNWQVCGLAKCLLTPGILNALGDVASRFGDSRPYGTNIEDSVAEAQITIDSKSGQDCSLVLDTIWIKAQTNNLSSVYVAAARRCDDKKPTLYSRYIRALVDTGDYNQLQQDVLTELRAWQPGCEGGHFSRCGSGFALVSLAKLVQR